MSFLKEAEVNFSNLQANEYPGRGIVIGTSPCGKYLVQVYWIMGRSENSRNRIFVLEDSGFLKTQAFDESKCSDTHLIIYYPARHLPEIHIITNGDQTDTIYEGLQKGLSFESSLATREYEDDAPNFTPRISGIVYKDSKEALYKLSILKTRSNSEEAGCMRFTYAYEKSLPGYGHYISTYQGNGNPIPSFSGEPLLMPIENTAEETLEKYWNALNQDNKVSMLVKWIDKETFEAKTLVRNKLVP